MSDSDLSRFALSSPVNLLDNLKAIRHYYQQIQLVITGDISEENKGVLTAFHNESTHLLHVSRWGLDNSEELEEQIESGLLAFKYDEDGQKSLINLEGLLPYKTSSFSMALLGANQEPEIIFIPKNADSVDALYDAALFEKIIENELEEKNLLPEWGERINDLAEILWQECDWEDPFTVMGENGIDFFIQLLQEKIKSESLEESELESESGMSHGQ